MCVGAATRRAARPGAWWQLVSTKCCASDRSGEGSSCPCDHHQSHTCALCVRTSRCRVAMDTARRTNRTSAASAGSQRQRTECGCAAWHASDRREGGAQRAHYVPVQLAHACSGSVGYASARSHLNEHQMPQIGAGWFVGADPCITCESGPARRCRPQHCLEERLRGDCSDDDYVTTVKLAGAWSGPPAGATGQGQAQHSAPGWPPYQPAR